MLKEINKQLDTLYQAYDAASALGIRTHFRLEGQFVDLWFYQEDNKFSRLTTDPGFSEWMAWSTGDWKKAAPMIEALAKPYGAAWDNEKGALYIRFRRNEMALAQAVLRLQQAAIAVSRLGPV